MMPDRLLYLLCPGLSLSAIALILFFVFLYQFTGPCLYFFAIYFVPASQEILVLKCGQNDLTPGLLKGDPLLKGGNVIVKCLYFCDSLSTLDIIVIMQPLSSLVSSSFSHSILNKVTVTVQPFSLFSYLLKVSAMHLTNWKTTNFCQL
jgi:hypothetical protein